MARYWIYLDDRVQGPLTTEALAHLIRQEQVTLETPVRVDGGEEWQRAVEVRALDSLFAPQSPPRGGSDTVVMPRALVPNAEPRRANDAPAPQKPPSRRIAWKRMVGVVAALGGLLVLAVAVVMAWRQRGGRAAVVPAEIMADGLPSEIRSLSVFSLKTASSGEAGLLASGLAPLCGGQNIASVLLAARDATTEGDAANLRDLLQRDDVRAGLRCGSGLARAMRGASVLSLTFSADDALRGVDLLASGAVDDVPGLERHNFSGLVGRCHPVESGSGDCAPTELAFARRGGWVALGPAASVAPYAREWNRSADRTVSSDMEDARLLVGDLEVEAVSTRLEVRPEVVALDELCRAVPSGEPGCFPESVQTSLERIAAKSRGHATQSLVPLPSMALRPDLFWRMSFACRDEEDAGDVARDLADVVRDWTAHLENQETAFVRRIRQSGAANRDTNEIVFRAFVRAMRGAVIDTDGRLARLAARTQLSESEQREVQSSFTNQRGRREAASRLIQSLVAGQSPQRADLIALVGSERARDILTPRADATSCAEVRAHIDAFAAAGIPVEEFGARYRLQTAFADAACVGQPRPPEVQRCLVTAASLTAMEACVAPPVAAEQRPPGAGSAPQSGTTNSQAAQRPLPETPQTPSSTIRRDLRPSGGRSSGGGHRGSADDPLGGLDDL
jgi:hypothetical protein